LFSSGTEHASLPFQLFLSSDPQKLGAPLHDPDGNHKYPEFLELGVILLEIRLGQKLGSYLRLGTDISNYADLWWGASKAFQERKLHIMSRVYRDAIDRCLKPDFSVSGTGADQKLRDSLFRHIVKPKCGHRSAHTELVSNVRNSPKRKTVTRNKDFGKEPTYGPLCCTSGLLM
jgi:hypothetical protein